MGEEEPESKSINHKEHKVGAKDTKIKSGFIQFLCALCVKPL